LTHWSQVAYSSHGEPMTGVGAGVGTGVGNGVGTGVGTGVGSGVGTGVGAGVGTGVGLNVEPGGSGVGAGDGAEGDGPGVGGRDVTPGLLVAAEVNVISGAAVVDPGPLVNATAPVEPDSVVLAASSASNHSQPVDSSLHSSIESNSAQNASPSSSSMATSSSAATPIAQITRRKTKIVSFFLFLFGFLFLLHNATSPFAYVVSFVADETSSAPQPYPFSETGALGGTTPYWFLLLSKTLMPVESGAGADALLSPSPRRRFRQAQKTPTAVSRSRIAAHAATPPPIAAFRVATLPHDCLSLQMHRNEVEEDRLRSLAPHDVDCPVHVPFPGRDLTHWTSPSGSPVHLEQPSAHSNWSQSPNPDPGQDKGMMGGTGVAAGVGDGVGGNVGGVGDGVGAGVGAGVGRRVGGGNEDGVGAGVGAGVGVGHVEGMQRRLASTHDAPQNLHLSGAVSCKLTHCPQVE
jgi:hypothetical protein